MLVKRARDGVRGGEKKLFMVIGSVSGTYRGDTSVLAHCVVETFGGLGQSSMYAHKAPQSRTVVACHFWIHPPPLAPLPPSFLT